MRISLKTRISLLIILVAVSITIATSAIYLIDQINKGKEYENTLLYDTQRIAETLAYVVTPYLIESNYVFMNKLVSDNKLHASYAYVLITDEKNRVLVHSANENVGGVFETPAQHGAGNAGEVAVLRYIKDGKEHIEVSQPVKAGDLVIGTVRIGLSTEWLQKEKIRAKQTIFKLSLASIVIMFLGILSAVLIAGSISKPILLLKQKAEQIGKGNYNQDIHLSRNDEVGMLALSFEQMLVDLRDSRSQIEKRTQALEDINNELQQVNRELLLRREEAEAASRAKTDFLANMSHELRTPLNAILGFADILQMGMAGQVTDKQKGLLNDIYTSGNHLLELITDILDLSKVEAGKMELEPGTFSLKELFDASIIMFKEKALKHGISATAEIADAITSITADKRKLKQVIVNLLSNAFKFTPDGGSVRVSARRVRSDEFGVGSSESQSIYSELITQNSELPEGTVTELRTKNSELNTDLVEISVEDTGIGISSEDQQRLFQPFQQIETSLTRKFAGTGLGLSLCRRFVELHGGRIWVESEEGKGSRFVFVIPITQ